MSQPFKLYRLQQVDSQCDRHEARLVEITAALNESRELEQAQSLFQSANKELETVRKNLRKAEVNVRDQRLKIEQTEATLYGGKVRNPKELQDLQNETAALKRYLSVLEDRQLAAMLDEEQSAEQSATAEKNLQEVQSRHESRLEALRQEQMRLKMELAGLEEERQAAASGIPDADMKIYTLLRKQRRGIAVTLVSDRACSACGSTLNAALLDAARTSSNLNRCDACGRILYIV